MQNPQPSTSGISRPSRPADGPSTSDSSGGGASGSGTATGRYPFRPPHRYMDDDDDDDSDDDYYPPPPTARLAPLPEVEADVSQPAGGSSSASARPSLVRGNARHYRDRTSKIGTPCENFPLVADLSLGSPSATPPPLPLCGPPSTDASRTSLDATPAGVRARVLSQRERPRSMMDGALPSLADLLLSRAYSADADAPPRRGSLRDLRRQDSRPRRTLSLVDFLFRRRRPRAGSGAVIANPMVVQLDSGDQPHSPV